MVGGAKATEKAREGSKIGSGLACLPLLFSVAVIQGRSHQAGQAERGFADKHLGQQLPGSGVGVFAQDAGIDGVLGLVDDGQKHQASDADAD